MSVENGFFVVRQGKGDGATYALCTRYETVPGNYQIPGTSKTAEQVVDEQNLMAAFVTSRKTTVVASMTVNIQNAEL